MKNSIIHQKSLELGIAVAKFSITLKDQKMYEIASQFLKSGTSIGANVHEATGGQSDRDFIHKLEIALKECYETLYRCEILTQGFEIECVNIQDLSNECIKILVAIIKSMKAKTK